MTRHLALLSACLVVFTWPAVAADWPQWRGPDRTGASAETGLLGAWPAGGPPLVWTFVDAGLGFSGPAVVGDRLYTLGAHDEVESVFALDVRTGREVWRTPVGPIYSFPGNTFGDGPRSTPTVDGDLVYALGGLGELVCVEAGGGQVRWRTNLLRDLGGELPETDGSPATVGWGYAQGPLMDGEQVVVAPGGPRGTLAALDKRTGAVLWRSTALADQATYASAVVGEVDGVRQYVTTTSRGREGGAVVGVAARDGRLLWEYPQPRWDIIAIVPTPILHEGHVYVTAGYGAGCDLLRLDPDGRGSVRAEPRYAHTKCRVMKNQMGGVVRVDRHLFGHSDGRGWVCQDFWSGDLLWQERSKLPGQGSVTYADGRLYLCSETGTVVLLEASPAGWREGGRFDLPQASRLRKARPTCALARVWTPPVVANGRLYLRDQEYLFCFDVADRTAPAAGGR